MTKMAATSIAAALVLTLTVGAFALTTNLGLSEAATNAGPTTQVIKGKRPKPVVKVRTIRRHKKAGGNTSAPIVIPASSSSGSSGGGSQVRAPSVSSFQGEPESAHESDGGGEGQDD